MIEARLHSLGLTYPEAKPLVGEFGQVGEYLIGDEGIRHLLGEVGDFTKGATADLFPRPIAAMSHVETRMWHNHFGLLNNLMPLENQRSAIPGLYLAEGEFDSTGLFYCETSPGYLDLFYPAPVGLKRFYQSGRRRYRGIPQSHIMMGLYPMDESGRYVVEKYIDEEAEIEEVHPLCVKSNHLYLAMGLGNRQSGNSLGVFPGEYPHTLLVADLANPKRLQNTTLNQSDTGNEALMRLFFWQLNRDLHPDLRYK